MSLKAWYPFDGNAKNYGAGNFELTQTAAPSYVDGGKVCKQSLSTGGFKWTAEQSSKIFNNKAMSFAFWIKPLNTNSGQIFGVSGMTAPNNRRFALFAYPTGNDFHWSWQNDNSGSTFTGGSKNGCFPTNVWTHCCITYENPNATVYINGVKVTTSTGVSACSNFAYETPVIHNSGNRYIQDFRVYDHCLSPREVRHLAQGLAWHCKMNSISNPNLITSMSGGGRSTAKGKYALDIDFGANTDAYGYFNVSPALVLNKTYTLSFDVKNFPAGGVWGWQLWNDGDYTFNVTKDGHYEYTFTPTAAKLPTDHSLTKFLFDDGGRTGAANIVSFTNFKIEEGSSATPWCPHTTDTDLYPIFEAKKDIENDCSGYGYNGTRYGVKGSGNSARYLHCGDFAAGNYIRTDSMYTVGWTDFTMSAWVNPTTYAASGGSTDRQTIIIGGMYLTLESGVVSTYCYGKTTKYYSGKTKVPLNEWSHIAVTYDTAGNLKIYLNGAVDATYTGLTGACENQQFHKQKEIGAETNGSSRRYAGKIADVRIYATALSEADIKELYSIATTYTEGGSLLTYEIDDSSSANNIKYYSSNTKASGFSEVGYIGGMKTKALSDGSGWARIHWLDVTNDNTYFANNDEVAFCNKKNRFSKMGLVDHFKTENGVYEFMLTYPRMSSTGYNRWTQTSSPNESTVTGFSSKVGTWTQEAHSGLRKHGSACVYNCDTGSSWYAPIGQKSQWTTGKYIPAANGESTTETELWVRIDNLPDLTKISMLEDKYIQAFEIKEL